MMHKSLFFTDHILSSDANVQLFGVIVVTSKSQPQMRYFGKFEIYDKMTKEMAACLKRFDRFCFNSNLI